MKKVFLLFVVLGFLTHNIFSQTYTWTGATNDQWNDQTNWDIGDGTPGNDGIPGGSNNVILDASITFGVNVTIGGNQSCNNLTLIDDFFGVNITFDAGSQLTINGNLTTTDAGFFASAFSFFDAGSYSLRLNGSINLDPNSAHNFNIPSGNIFFQASAAAQVIPAGIFGNIIISNTGNKSFAGGTVQVRGINFVVTAANIDFSGSTIYFNGTGSQTVRNLNFNNIRIGSSSSITLNSTGEIGVSGTFILDGTNAFTNTGSTVRFNGVAAQSLDISGRSGAATFNNIIIDNPAGFTLTGNLNSTNLAGNLDINQGNFNAQSNTVASAGGTFRIGSTAAFSTEATNGFPTGFSTYNLEAGSTVAYSASGAQNIAGNNVANFNGTYSFLDINIGSNTKTVQGNISIQRVLDIDQNTLNLNGNSLTITSNASGTAAIAPINGGGISGNVTVERFLNDGNGWYIFGAPVTSTTFNDWLNDFNITSNGTDIVGADFQTGFNSLSYYEEDKGGGGDDQARWSPVPNLANAIVNGRGYASWQQNDQKSGMPKTVTSTGSVNGAGGATISTSNSGGGSGAGLNLLANPFASPIAFGDVTISNLQGGASVLDVSSGNFGPPAGGIIASGEAFFVQVSGGGTASFPQSAKREFENDVFNKRKSANFSDLGISLKIIDGNHSNTAYLKFAEDATINRDDKYDTKKIDNMYGRTDIAMLVDDTVNVITNAVPVDTNFAIPVLVYRNSGNGQMRNVSMEISNVTNDLEKGLCLQIIDLNTNTSFAITGDTVFAFSMLDTQKTPRFEISVSRVLDTEVQNVSCLDFEDGKLIANSLENGNYNFIWTNMQQQVIRTSYNKSTDTLDNLKAGFYTVEINGHSNCPSVKQKLDVQEPETKPTADFSIVTDSIFIDQSVKLENKSTNAKDYLWNMGDGTIYSQFEPEHYYNEVGNYSISLTASINGECPETKSSNLIVKSELSGNPNSVSEISEMDEKIQIFQNNYKAFIQFELDNSQDFTITFLDISGKIVSQIELNGVQNDTKSFELPQASGIYIVEVRNNQTFIHKKLIKTN